jgi:hypothetical protein
MAISVILRINNIKFSYISKDLHKNGDGDIFQLHDSPLKKSRASIFTDQSKRDLNVI